MAYLTVRDLSVAGKRILVRVDFNVPLDAGGNVLDDTKIRASLPTLQYLLAKGAKKIILASHLGRPGGKIVANLRLDPVAKRLSQLLKGEVLKSDQVVGGKVEKTIREAPPGSIILLENLRFQKGEEKNEPALAAALARLADLFVNDAFAAAHRAHASNVGIANYLPAAAGLLMEKEIFNLSKARENPSRPLVALLGGKKIADKIGVIHNFLNNADYLLLGGGMANTFLRSKGFSMGDSLYDRDQIDLAAEIMNRARESRAEIHLPFDLLITEKLVQDSPFKIVRADQIPAGWSAVDLGPQTVKEFSGIILKAKTILWNGPLGAYEFAPFHRGTEMIARAIVGTNAQSIIGGGDLVAAIRKLGLSEQITHLSTGGGAVLNFWEGKQLPGLLVLQEKGRG